MKKTVLIFGFLTLALLVLFQMSQYAIISGDTKIEIVIGIIAVVFFFVGMYINKKNRNQVNSESIVIDQKKIDALEISKREYEILQQIASGLSNKEIADKLFLSESTIKTHVSNLLLKLNAKRRTQAVQIAKSLNLI